MVARLSDTPAAREAEVVVLDDIMPPICAATDAEIALLLLWKRVRLLAKDADASKEAVASASRLASSWVSARATDAENMGSSPLPLPEIYAKLFQSATPLPILSLPVLTSNPPSPLYRTGLAITQLDAMSLRSWILVAMVYNYEPPPSSVDENTVVNALPPSYSIVSSPPPPPLAIMPSGLTKNCFFNGEYTLL